MEAQRRKDEVGGLVLGNLQKNVDNENPLE